MRLLAFDPSLLNLGMSVGSIVNDKLEVSFATTYYVDRLVRDNYPDYSWDIPENTKRLSIVEKIVEEALSKYNPEMVIIELPVMGKNVKSLMVQMKCITLLESIIYKRNREGIRYNIVEYMPNIIKLGVGVTEGGKEFITEGLLSLVDSGSLIYLNDKHGPTEVDEHANDSVAMLYTKYSDIINNYSA